MTLASCFRGGKWWRQKPDRFEVKEKQAIMRNESGKTFERVACQMSREIRGPQESNTGEIKADWSSKG